VNWWIIILLQKAIQTKTSVIHKNQQTIYMLKSHTVNEIS